MEIYEFNGYFDLVKSSLLFLMILGLFSMFIFKSFSYRNKYVFLLFGLAVAALFNTYLIKFHDPQFYNFIASFILALGPTLLFFIKNAIKNERKIAKAYCHHLAFGIIMFALVLLNILKGHEILIVYFVFGHFGIYLFWSIHLLVSKKVVVLRTNETQNRTLHRWMDNFNILLTISFVYITFLVETFFSESIIKYRFSIIAIVLGAVFLLLRNLTINAIKGYSSYRVKNDLNTIEKYKDSILSKQQSKKLAEKLEEFMNVKKPYLDENVNLKTLSLELRTHPKNISQAINENHQKNFFDYVNTYRIEDAKKMLKDSSFKEYKIYEIMFEVGFNSRSSFNAAFKRNTGITARQYRERNFKNP